MKHNPLLLNIVITWHPNTHQTKTREEDRTQLVGMTEGKAKKRRKRAQVRPMEEVILLLETQEEEEGAEEEEAEVAL